MYEEMSENKGVYLYIQPPSILMLLNEIQCNQLRSELDLTERGNLPQYKSSRSVKASEICQIKLENKQDY